MLKEYIDYYPNKVIRQHYYSCHHSFLREGIYRSWHINGNRQYESFFIEGHSHGIQKEYNEQDNLEHVYISNMWVNNGVNIRLKYVQNT